MNDRGLNDLWWNTGLPSSHLLDTSPDALNAWFSEPPHPPQDQVYIEQLLLWILGFLGTMARDNATIPTSVFSAFLNQIVFTEFLAPVIQNPFGSVVGQDLYELNTFGLNDFCDVLGLEVIADINDFDLGAIVVALTDFEKLDGTPEGDAAHVPCTVNNCFRTFLTDESRDQHVRLFHQNPNCFACHEAGYMETFTTERHLHQHMRREHGMNAIFPVPR
ncbi:hypothetical protein BC940DRAFT_334139 [Gongronella butleri]|nr:hypothetical protein BC940DRAFT_334139 [Gongronella butleri]